MGSMRAVIHFDQVSNGVCKWTIGVQQPRNLHATALSQHLASSLLSHAAATISMDNQLAQMPVVGMIFVWHGRVGALT